MAFLSRRELYHIRNCSLTMHKLTLIVLLTASLFARAQNAIPENVKSGRVHINKSGMTVLGSWALANTAFSLIRYRNGSLGQQYTYDMNMMFSAVNLGIAGLGYLAAVKEERSVLTTDQNLQNQLRMERILAFNAGLDVAYVTCGFLLREMGERRDSDMLRGYGTSVIYQGGFLLLFDTVMFMMHRKNGKPLLGQSVQLNPSATGIGLQLNF